MIYLYEGDNLDVIKKMKVKPNIVYLDPPYGTKNKNLIYIDNQIEHNWSEMFESRLLEIKKIIDKNAVIYVSIGSEELGHAIISLDNVFGRKSQVAIMPRLTVNTAKTTHMISKVHDFVLVYKVGRVAFKGLEINTDSYRLKDKYSNERGFYQRRRLDYNSFKYSKTLDTEINFEGKEFFPGDPISFKARHKAKPTVADFDWCWLWSDRKISFAIENGYIEEHKGFLWKKTYTKSSIVRTNGEYSVVNQKREKPITSLQYSEAHYATNKKVGLERLFSYPKSKNLIVDLLLRPKFKEKIVLDAFAGSGITGIIANELGIEAHLIQRDEKVRENSRIFTEHNIDNIFDLTKKILEENVKQNLKIVNMKKLGGKNG